MNYELTALLAQAHQRVEAIKRRTLTLNGCLRTSLTQDTLAQFHELYSEALDLEHTLELMTRAGQVQHG